MIGCEMCGRPARVLVYRWYKHDNGEQVRSLVCSKCADVHDMSLKGQKE
jgi:protein-arginine kinase activator protein McsA